jgi:poly(3-hydroxybutyrate) depolymerase
VAVAAGAVFAGVAIGCGIRLARSNHATPPAGPAPVATPTAPAPRSAAPKPLSSPGCGMAPATRTMSYATKSGRTFHVWAPGAYDPTRAYPVVLTFHGWYANGRAFQSWFKMEEHDPGAFTVYPDSLGATWELAGDRDLDFVADIIEAISNAYCIDRSHVFALGFSYGGKFVHHLGCKRPSLVRAIAVGDGSWAQETGCAPMPVLVTHRTHDHDERIEWGKDSAARWAKIDGCSPTPETSDTTHGCVRYPGCSAGSVTFCEDTHFDPTWPEAWNHTIREDYRALTWSWFKSVSEL